MVPESLLREALRAVIDPEIGLDIVTLGLVYEITVAEGGHVSIRLTMTTRGFPMEGLITRQVHQTLSTVPGVQEVHLEVVWEPAWSPERIEPQGRKLLRI